MKLILASGSPRRKELLEKRGYEFDIIKAVKDECTDKTKPADVVKDLSLSKAREVFDRILDEKLYEKPFQVLGSDTIVAFGDVILGKPVDRDDAKRMIQMIQNNNHQVYTGVAIIKMEELGETVVSFAEKTEVYVKPMTESEIEAYVATGECDDKAGAYGIQGVFGQYIDHIEGDLSNVIGLPVDKVIEYL